jgi:hypothetical protein
MLLEMDPNELYRLVAEESGSLIMQRVDEALQLLSHAPGAMTPDVPQVQAATAATLGGVMMPMHQQQGQMPVSVAGQAAAPQAQGMMAMSLQHQAGVPGAAMMGPSPDAE